MGIRLARLGKPRVPAFQQYLSFDIARIQLIPRRDLPAEIIPSRRIDAISVGRPIQMGHLLPSRLLVNRTYETRVSPSR